MKYPYVVERILYLYPDLKPDYIAKEVQRCSFVSLDKRYLYYQVPKAACTQMKEILRTVEGAPPLKLFSPGVWVTRRDAYVHARANLPLPSLIDLDNRTQRQVLESPDFFRVTVVRNPYKRLISAWRHCVFFCEPLGSEVYVTVRGGLPGFHDKSIVSFEEFISYLEEKCDLPTCNDHWRRQTDHLFLPALNFDCIGKLEEFGKTLRRLEQHLGLSEPLAASGSNASLPVGAASYTQELADKVYHLYRRDFDAFGYDRNSWPAGGGESVSAPEEKLCDEIMERNLVMLGLYERLERLEVVSRRVSRLHLLPVISSLAACRSVWRRIAPEILGGARGMFQKDGRGSRGNTASA